MFGNYPGSARQTPLAPYPNVPNVGAVLTADEVHYALGTRRAWNDPAYVFAVVRSYCHIKFSRGKNNTEVHAKLAVLERQVPGRYAKQFREIRQYYGLPASPMFGSAAPPSSSSNRAAVHRRTTSAPTSRRPVVVNATPAPAVTRASDDPSDEPPPPPYAAQDPDPESTATLQAQLAAQGQSTTGTTTGTSTSDAASIEAGSTHNELRRTSSEAQGTQGGRGYDSPRPNNLPATPAQRMGTVDSIPSSSINNRHSLPPMPPSSSSNGPSSAPAANNEDESDLERRLREESELEEAMRVSRMAEKERLEFEAAIEASLAEAEAEEMRRAIQGTMGPDPRTAGSSTGAGTAAEAGPWNQASSSGWNQASGSGWNQASGSRWNSGGQGWNGAAVQRSVSAPHRQLTESSLVDSVPSGSTLTVPGAAAAPVESGDGNIMDMLGQIDFNAPPLEPTPITPSATGLTAQRTGMQSNNPFLSPQERQASLSATSSGPSPVNPQDRALPPIPQESDTGQSQPGGWQSGGWQGGNVAEPASYAPNPPPSTTYTPAVNEYGLYSQAPVLSPVTEHSGYSPHIQTPPHVQTPPGHGYGHEQSAAVSQPDHSYVASPSTERSSRPLPTPGGSPLPPLPPRHNMTTDTPLTPPAPASLPSAAPTSSPVILLGGENALETLREYDTVFLVDDSTSMSGERWGLAKAAIMGVVRYVVGYDEDGIDVYFLNSKRVGRGLCTAEDVEELFAGLEPQGATPTGLRLEAILRDYLSRLEHATATGTTLRNMNLIVVTDGAFAVPVLHRIRSTAPDDRVAVLETAPTDDPESVLIAAAKRLDRGDFPLTQVGVQLLQIGDDEEASEALTELDEGLQAVHGVRDMVDTVPYRGEDISAALIVKVLLGGINRRVDRKKLGKLKVQA